ncbi:MAG: STN domain-containing protein [Planctomycetia bacterium]|nr:STN domain-containing protein [Planctomycetia bacterium]
MIGRIGAVLLAGALALPGWAEDTDETKSKILNRLENTKISLDFKDTNLDEVIDFLHEVTSINFVLSKEVREKAKAGELKVDVKLTDLPLKSALKLVLDMNGLTAVYRNGVLVIETKEERGKDVEMKMYDVRDLMMKIEDFPAPTIELRESEAGASVVGIVVAPEPTAHPFESKDQLVEIIRNATGGDSVWGKDGVSIDIQNGLLIVAQNADVQKEIEQLIVSLRQFK